MMTCSDGGWAVLLTSQCPHPALQRSARLNHTSTNYRLEVQPDNQISHPWLWSERVNWHAQNEA